MFSTLDYTIVVVSDMARSVAFYRDTLGLRLKFESKFWSEFEAGDTTLALHGGGEPNPGPEERMRAGTCFIGFTVPDLEAAVRELEAKGVVFSTPPTERPEEGIKVAICSDPDGLAISIAEVQ
jgi:catechol 2,3-dioxygenase-like lactoylglutathione lyase family enzyme